MLHLWLKALTEAEASLSVTVEAQPIASPATRRTGEFAFVAVPLSAGGLTALSYDPAVTMLSVAYAFHPDRVTAEGITVLHHEGRNAPPLTPDSYHFRPPFGWMNDPNGFGRFGGTAHLFYQHYPHSLRWNTMHWGHAISTDFLHWTHQPVFLFPADHLSEKDDGRGGAFSGSAIAAGDAIRVFYTEHVIDRTPEEQIQLTAVSQDGLLAGASDIILPLRPEGLNLTTDFRDPYVFEGPDGRWKMLLGSRDKGRRRGAALRNRRSRRRDGLDLHRHHPPGRPFRHDGGGMPLHDPGWWSGIRSATRWALIFGLLTSRDPATGRRNLTSVTVGRFDGRSFAADFEQELDFGSDAYAFQAFVDGDAPVGIAWLANWTDVSKKEDFQTAMTLPRRVLIEGDAIFTPPVAAVESLRHRLIDETALAGERLSISTPARSKSF